MAHQAEDEHSVLTEVLLNEAGGVLLVLLGAGVDLVHEAQVLLHVAVAVRLEDGAHGPGDEAEAGHRGHEHHPEPEAKVDLLVEQIDGQDALHGVGLHVSKAAHLEVAHGDTGEAGGLGPVLTLDQGADHIQAVHVVVLAEEGVQGKDLADHVNDVEQLDKDVEDAKVVAFLAAAEEAACPGDTVLQADCTTRLVLLLCSQVPVQHTNNTLFTTVADNTLAFLHSAEVVFFVHLRLKLFIQFQASVEQTNISQQNNSRLRQTKPRERHQSCYPGVLRDSSPSNFTILDV